MSSYSPYCTIMTTKYFEHLFEIGIKYKRYKTVVKLFFTQCLGGDSSPIIKDLKKLVDSPPEKYGPNDWKLLVWVKNKVKGIW